ncbi:hypothetical protein CISIN_1g046738mg, partial [Citrus sinensis]
VHEQLIKRRQVTVVVKLLGRMVGYKAVVSRLEALWPNIGGFSVIDLDNGYYLVHFCSENTAEFTSHFDCSIEKIEKIMAWICLTRMPLHYYHKKIIRLLGYVVRKIIKIDYNMQLAILGKFARIVVEVYLDRPLISQFLLDGKIQKVEYGHTNSSCPEKLNIEPQDANVKIPNSNKIPNGKLSSAPTTEKVALNYGPWMVVAQKGNQNWKGNEKIQDYANHQNGNLNRGSKFGVLLVDDDGGNNQNEGNESLIAILSNRVPIITYPHALNGSKNSAIRKNSLDQNLVDKQPSRAQH